MISKEEENNVEEENVRFTLVIIHQTHSFRQMGRQFDQGSEHPKDQASGCSKKKALSIMNPRKKDEDAEGRERERERDKMLKDKNQSILFIILAHILSVCS
jgi:hypothetical protein